jgi:hypothetical protein
MSRASSLLVCLLAAAGCPAAPSSDDGEASESAPTASGDDSSDGSTASGDETSGGSGPSGPCPLEGMFVECTGEGIAYCDEIDGELQWGPCQPSPACELGPLEGCQSCTLEEGVPTVTGSPTCECEAPAASPCEQTECLQRWDYSCGSCKSFSSGDCFSYDQGCTSPFLGCNLLREPPCDRIWAQSNAGFNMLDALEDEAAATCVLTSLRDDVPGTYQIIWGYMDDGGWVSEWIHVVGDGTAIVEWVYDCPGCYGFGSVGRSGVLSLRPDEWFDDCLAEPTTESLIQCTVGLSEFQPGNPPPEGYVPPFVTGDCVSLDAACP